MRRGGKTSITASTATTARDDLTLIGAGKIVNAFAGLLVIKNCANRNLEHNIAAFAAGLVRAFAVPSTLRVVFRIEAKVDERVVPFARLHDHIAALAAVAARRAAARDELF